MTTFTFWAAVAALALLCWIGTNASRAVSLLTELVLIRHGPLPTPRRPCGCPRDGDHLYGCQWHIVAPPKGMKPGPKGSP